MQVIYLNDWPVTAGPPEMLDKIEKQLEKDMEKTGIIKRLTDELNDRILKKLMDNQST